MRRTSIELAYDEGVIHAVWVPAQRPSGPLIVAIHGAAYTWDYFDAVDNSLITLANANGVSVLAVDRPNNGRSSPLPLVVGSAFKANADAISQALAGFWREHGEPYDGAVLVGHSMGGMITIHLAAGEHEWPLLGVCSDGFGSKPGAPLSLEGPPLGPGTTVTLPPAVRRSLMYGPDGTFHPEALTRATTGSALFEEIDNADRAWTSELAVLGPSVSVPVCLSLTEAEPFWSSGKEAIAALASFFPNSPWVETPLIPGAGHNIDHHLVGHGFNLRRIGFALSCAALHRQGGS